MPGITSLLYCVKILVNRYNVDPPKRFVMLACASLPNKKMLTTKFVIAANARINIKYPLVRDTPTSVLNVLEAFAPERMSKRSTPCNML